MTLTKREELCRLVDKSQYVVDYRTKTLREAADALALARLALAEMDLGLVKGDTAYLLVVDEQVCDHHWELVSFLCFVDADTVRIRTAEGKLGVVSVNEVRSVPML